MDPLQIVFLEDNDLDVEAVRALLEYNEVDFILSHVRTRPEFEAALQRNPIDVILSDFSLPQFNGFAALNIARQAKPHTPFILLSGEVGEEIAVECLKQGATDYILKERLARLPEAVKRAHREALTARKRRQAEKRSVTFSELGRILNSAREPRAAAHHIAQAAARLLDWDACNLVLYQPDEEVFQSLVTIDLVDGERRDVPPVRERSPLPPLIQRVLRGEPLLILRDPARHPKEDLIPFGDTGRRSASLLFAPIYSDRDVVGILTVQSYTPGAYDQDDLDTLKALADHCGGALERLRAEHQHRQSEERYRRLIENSRDLISEVSLEGRYRYLSPNYHSILGYSPEELIGRDLFELVHPDDVEELRQKFSKRVPQSLFRYRHANGEWRWLEAAGQLMEGTGSQTESGVIISRDVTERRRLEQQSLRNQRMESIGTLASGIAHDLNNVLAPIMMSVELLKMGEPDQDQIRLLNTLQASAQRGADMVQQVLAFGRGVEGNRLSVQLTHLIRDLHKIIDQTFPKNIQLRQRLASDLWVVSGDPTQLHQVLLNLCVNARDAMPDGGILTLAAENVLLDDLFAKQNTDAKPGPHVCLRVEDSGTGIPQSVLDKIFDPFFTTKEVGKGTGLGLSTSMVIVKNHDGFIRVQSEPGKGSSFTIYLPAITHGQAPDLDTFEPDVPHGHGELILVADDEASVRQVIKQTLEVFGYRILLASNGAEAVSTYTTQQEEIAAVITDMRMPVMDGPAAIHALLKINPQTRIIAMTGLCSAGHEASAAIAGAKAFLPKPYNASSLLRTLHELLNSPS